MEQVYLDSIAALQRTTRIARMATLLATAMMVLNIGLLAFWVTRLSSCAP